MRIEQTRRLFVAGILPKPSATQDLSALSERLSALRLVFAAEQHYRTSTLPISHRSRGINCKRWQRANGFVRDTACYCRVPRVLAKLI